MEKTVAREKEVWEMKKSFFISAGFASANNGRWESGLSGQRHVGNFADVDGLQELQAVDVLNVRRKIAMRSRPPQIRISDMLLTYK